MKSNIGSWMKEQAATRDALPKAPALSNLSTVKALVDRGALFAVSHSGGKDSQAMLIELKKLVPADQLMVIHAELGDVVWTGAADHARAGAGALPYVVAEARWKDGSSKDLLQMAEKRGMFPGQGQARWCTSDLKRDPIARETRHYLAANPQYGGLVVSCQGIRAEESQDRAKRSPLELDKRNSKAGREWYEWYPIFDWTVEEVFASIKAAGEKPHWAYQAGMTRMSCAFCIYGNRSDLTTAARLNPELYARYVGLEKKIGFTLQHGRSLEETTGIKVKLAA